MNFYNDSYYYCYNNDYLQHFGVKGMKWGVRRYQNKDGTLTNAGKKRYKDDPTVQKSKAERDNARVNYKNAVSKYNNAYNKYGYYPTKKNKEAYKQALKQLSVARSKYDRAKLTYSTDKEAARIKNKDIKFENKSKHRLKLEEEYKKLGMSDEQAQAAANNRIRTEKILAASAAVTVAGCALYIANKERKKRIDGIIKAGESLQRIEMQDTGGKLHDVFYASKGSHDNKRYVGLLGYTRKQQTGHAYIMELSANKDIKVASQDKAAKIFGDLYKNDPDFASKVRNSSKAHFTGKNIISDEQLNNPSNRVIKKMYENFNSSLVLDDVKNTGVDKTFYNKLKESGYGAIQDINDMKYSGYKSKNPLIVFDKGDNIMVKSMTEMANANAADYIKELGKANVENYIDTYGTTAAVGLAATTSVYAVGAYNSNPSQYYKK